MAKEEGTEGEGGRARRVEREVSGEGALQQHSKFTLADFINEDHGVRAATAHQQCIGYCAG